VSEIETEFSNLEIVFTDTYGLDLYAGWYPKLNTCKI